VIGILEIIGYLAALLFSISTIPQAYQCYKQKHANGINLSMLVMWALGEILMLIYVIGTLGLVNIPLIITHVVTIILLIVIFRYKLFPDGK